jgi:hypothetical protein
MPGESTQALFNALFIANIGKTDLKTGSLTLKPVKTSPYLHHEHKPTCCFKATVLPPVLGPVMSKVLNFSPMEKSKGTAFAAGSNGCLPLLITKPPFYQKLWTHSMRIQGKISLGSNRIHTRSSKTRL